MGLRRKGDDDGSRDEQLECVVSLRLTPSDHAVWLSKVEASGQTRSEFFRSCVLGNRTEVIAKKSASADKRRLLYLFNKASNNMNQIAHAANVAELSGTVTPATYAGILAELQDIADMMRGVIDNAD